MTRDQDYERAARVEGTLGEIPPDTLSLDWGDLDKIGVVHWMDQRPKYFEYAPYLLATPTRLAAEEMLEALEKIRGWRSRRGCCQRKRGRWNTSGLPR